MSKQSKKSKQESSNPQCDVCGSPSSAGGSYHHFTVPIPGDGEDTLWQVAKVARKDRLRTFGPNDLLNMVNERQDIGGFTVLAAAVQRLQPGDFVKLCFRVTDRNPVWLDDAMRAMLQRP